ncbi:HU family DNA-binding protein [Verminephrobacter eiseniae]|uniref:HU family DNA-binding protein n=1 Tax=Verminephrobacter eiseniae TaxID=364317 RepID=UPI0038B3B991|nr:hypothetical protein [Verminephrobacter eiseniae]
MTPRASAHAGTPTCAAGGSQRTNITHWPPKTLARTYSSIGTGQSAVVHGVKVTRVGFGLLEAILAKPRTGRHPRTGQKVDIGEKRPSNFTPGHRRCR